MKQSGKKWNQSEKKRSMDVTFNDNTVTSSQALKILFNQLKNVKRQKQEEFYRFNSKQPNDYNMKELLSEVKY